MPSVILSEKQFKKINEEQDDNHLNSIKYFLLQQSNRREKGKKVI